MFVNFTNHPSAVWAEAQLKAAALYGEITDIAFPVVNPKRDEAYITALAEDYAAKIYAYRPAAVLCQGEMTLTFAVAGILMHKYGLTVLAACSERSVSKGNKAVEFKFVRFREYVCMTGGINA
jgi:hypothetical protein